MRTPREGLRHRARALAVAGLMGCTVLGCAKGRRPDPLVPAEDRSRADDAAQLPTFMDSEGAEGETGVERFYVEVGDAPTRGPATAPITIVMFSDFECPFCRRGHDTLMELERRHRGQVRIVYKAFPLDIHGNALLAAMAARTAQAKGKFWEFHDLLYGDRELEVPTLVDYARQVGLDPDAMIDDINALEYGPEVRRDMRQARKLGVTSTPTFFVNGRQISGAKPIDEFEALIEEELGLVEQWLASGVAANGIYAHAIKDGFKEVVYTRRGRGLDPDAVFPVPVAESPTLGPADAPVTIVMFGDFECPFCARGFQTIEALREHYGPKLRLVYKHNPLSFHSHAFLAARASAAAHQQGKFWAFHDALYRLEARFDEKDLAAIAKKVGLDMKKYHQAMNDTTLDRHIEADLGLAMALGVTGTPAYFINGRAVEGALPELQFRLLIEEELERAAKARADGVPSERLYETLTHTALEG